MQRRFTERHVNTKVEWCFVIGQCHGNNVLFDVGVDGAFSETSLHKVPSVITSPNTPTFHLWPSHPS